MCRFCETVMRTKDLERILKHLCKCPKVPPRDRDAALSDYEQRYGRSAFTTLKRPYSVTLENTLANAGRRLKDVPSGAPPINTAVSKWVESTALERQLIDQELAMTFYHIGLPFSMSESPQFAALLGNLCPGYSPPSRQALATELLDSSYDKILAETTAVLEKDTDEHLTLVTDGWKTERGENITNYILVTQSGQSIFHASCPRDTERMPSEDLAQDLLNVINAAGPTKIKAICTDTAKNMKRAMAIVLRSHPHIHAFDWTSQDLSLLAKDALELPALKAVLTQVSEVSNWFRNDKQVYSHLKAMQRHMYKEKFHLSRSVSTRLQSIPANLQALINSREALEAVTISSDVTKAMLTTEAGKAVRKLVLDIDWWSEVQGLLTMVAPLLAYSPEFSKLYMAYNRIRDAATRNLESEDPQSAALEKFNARWRKIDCTEIVLASYFDLSLVGGDYEPPEMDDQTRERVMKYFKTTYKDDALAEKLNDQLGDLLARAGVFADEFLLRVSAKICPYIWWRYHFDNELSTLALELLAIRPSSGMIDRLWSTHGFINNSSRIGLQSERAKRLVYVSTNARLLTEYQSKGPPPNEDSSDDESESEEESTCCSAETLDDAMSDDIET